MVDTIQRIISNGHAYAVRPPRPPLDPSRPPRAPPDAQALGTASCAGADRTQRGSRGTRMCVRLDHLRLTCSPRFAGAQVEGGDVFFDVNSLPGYGRLSGRSQVRSRAAARRAAMRQAGRPQPPGSASPAARRLSGGVSRSRRRQPRRAPASPSAQDDNRAGERVAVDSRKRSPADFALWKAAKPGAHGAGKRKERGGGVVHAPACLPSCLHACTHARMHTCTLTCMSAGATHLTARTKGHTQRAHALWPLRARVPCFRRRAVVGQPLGPRPPRVAY